MDMYPSFLRDLSALPGCQFFSVIGQHSIKERVDQGMRTYCGVRTNVKRRISRTAPLGEPSRYAEGDWVQVLDREGVQRTLDADSKTRKLLFLPYQWDFCGGVFRVQKRIRRMLDDDGVFRPISRTVLLEGVDCGGVTGTFGCGRHCPLMFRDEWVKPAAAPAVAAFSSNAAFARVLSLQEIQATLGADGRRDGLAFMPEMARWAGQRHRIAKKVDRVFEFSRHTSAAFPIYILEGLQCSGTVLGTQACEKRCSILWHGDWLREES